MARVTRTFKHTIFSPEYIYGSFARAVWSIPGISTGNVVDWVKTMATNNNRDMKNVTFSNARFGSRLSRDKYVYDWIGETGKHSFVEVPCFEVRSTYDTFNYTVVASLVLNHRENYVFFGPSHQVFIDKKLGSPQGDGCFSLDIYIDITGDVGGELITKYSGVIKKTKSVVIKHSGIIKQVKSIYTKQNGVIKETK